MENSYDQIKKMLSASHKIFDKKITKLEKFNLRSKYISLNEQINDDKEYENDDEKTKSYKISGGILKLHFLDSSDLKLTSDDKSAFQESMDTFIDEVSDLVDFEPLNVYENYVEWGGKIIDKDISFFYTVGENSGVFIKTDMVKIDDEFINFVQNLESNYDKFRNTWARIIASRKETE